MMMSDAKRAPATGTRVVRTKHDVRSPGKGTLPSVGSFNGSAGGGLVDEDKKRRPYTTPSRTSYEVKRDPNTPTRTVRPYRPHTGGRDRLTSPPETRPAHHAVGMLTVVEDEPMGVMGKDEHLSEDIAEEPAIEWVDEDTPGPDLPRSPDSAAGNAAPSAAATPPRPQQHPNPNPSPDAVTPPLPAAARRVSVALRTPPPPLPAAPSPQKRQPSPGFNQLDKQLSPHPQHPANFGKDGFKVRTGSKALIGKGSFGCVFKGLHEGTNQIVAIKEVHLSGESAGKVNMIKKEIQLMKRLNHPNIVRYLGAERVQTQLHIYLEYVPGGSMASLVKEYGQLTEEMTRKYSMQVLEGLHYLHCNNIVHRDIKGDNLLVGHDGTVKLADFGTSKELRTLAATVTGTACFMAPEIIKGTGHGLASDVWSLGCAVIEMLNGKPPFCTFENQYATMMHVAALVSVDREIPEQSDELCQQFLRNCLEVDPCDRHTTAELLDSEWFLQHPEDALCTQASAGGGSAPVASPAPHRDSLFHSNGDAPQQRSAPSSAGGHPELQHADNSASSRVASGSSRSQPSTAASNHRDGLGMGSLPISPHGNRAPCDAEGSDVDSVRISHGDDDSCGEVDEECGLNFNPMESYAENC